MSAYTIRCASCGRPTCEIQATVIECVCGSRQTEAVQVPTKWNAEERARRAEMLAGRLAAALAEVMPIWWPIVEPWTVEGHAALAAWTAHRAALDAQGVPK